MIVSSNRFRLSPKDIYDLRLGPAMGAPFTVLPSKMMAWMVLMALS